MAKKYINNIYERQASSLATQSANAEWKYVTNLKNTTARDFAEELNIVVANFDKKQWKQYIRHFDIDSIKDPSVKRQLKILNVIGSAALPDDKLKKVK